MTTSIGGFTGLGSGFDYSSLVDAIIAQESAPAVMYTNQANKISNQETVLNSFQSLMTTLQTSLKSLSDGTGLQNTSTTLSGAVDPQGRTVLSATSSTAAVPGTYSISVNQLAQANQMSSNYYSSQTSSMGLAAGQSIINGAVLTLDGTESMQTLVNKINALNTGSTPSGVSASIQQDANGYRVLLNAVKTGKAGIDLISGAAGNFQAMGLLGTGTVIKNSNTSGANSDNFTSNSTAIGTLRGISSPASGTVVIGGKNIAINLATDSLTSIAAKINGAGGTMTASVVSSVVNGATMYHLDVRSTTSFTDSSHVLEQLGVVSLARTGISQVVSSGNRLTDGGAGGVNITTGTLLTNLQVNGTAANVKAGDTFTISGTKGDGSAASLTYTVAGGDTVQTLLTALQGAFSVAGHTVTGGVDGAGHITLSDGTAGTSGLNFNIVSNNQGGGTMDFGASTVTTVGRAREVVAGQDALVTVNGSQYDRTSNTMTDVVSGVTLNALYANPAQTAQMTVTNAAAPSASNVQAMVDAYNKVMDFIGVQMAPPPASTTGAAVALPALYGDSFLRVVRSVLPNMFVGTVGGAADGMNKSSDIGLQLDKTGHLTFDSNVFTTAYNSRFNDVMTLFKESGSSLNANVVYLSKTSSTKPGAYDVNITQAATVASATGTGFSGTYADDATPDAISVTDAQSSVTATLALANGMTTQQIVDGLNSVFTGGSARVLTDSGVLNSNPLGAVATGATAWSGLYTGALPSSVANGDTISYSGTRTNGSSYSGTYTIANASTGTVNDLLSAINAAIGTSDTVSMVNGQLVATSNTKGASALSLSVIANNQGGGRLNFGATTVTTAGGGPISVMASNVSGQVKLSSTSYGSAPGFTVAYTGGGTNNTAQLGLAAGTYHGLDVQGTIGGSAATGVGQALTSTAGASNGLSMSYLGTATGDMGNLTYTLGLMAQLNTTVSAWNDSITGTFKSKTDIWNNRIAQLQSRAKMINDAETRRRATLMAQFIHMDAVVSKLRQAGNVFGANQAAVQSFQGSSSTTSTKSY